MPSGRITIGTSTAASTGVPSRPGALRRDSSGIFKGRWMEPANTCLIHAGVRNFSGTDPNGSSDGTQGCVIGSNDGRTGARLERIASGLSAAISAY